ncbi:ScbR family autoregulator-binding transcription factor [Actinophytocola sp.]|uniref:ScbR family autoregulator-binding transcription factor n=1 Tax=Actinophytocola sp. TaxID=1872138 RepID=UPI003D6B3D15
MTKQSRAENTRLHLVRSAAELFDRNGFSGATLEDVSRAAGVTKGAFYFHFSSKDDLAGAIQAEACAMLRHAVYRSLDAGTPVLQSLIDLTHEIAHWLETEPVVRASLRTARECGHRGTPFLDFYVDLLSAVETMLISAEQAGEVSTRVAVDQASTLVLTICAGMDMLWWSGIRAGDIRANVREMWELILPGMVGEDGLARVDPAGPARLG